MVRIVLGDNLFETDESLDDTMERYFRLWLLALSGIPAQQEELDSLVARLRASTNTLEEVVGETNA